MYMRNFIHPMLFTALCLLLGTHAQADDIPYVAGTKPSERPATAPAITETDKGAAWYDNALHGVGQPYPYSLHFLENQGNWFTPFTHPGMTDRYDLRGWHGK
jgi:hypothetical protein